MDQKQLQKTQIYSLQKQIAAMEHEIEQLYAERKALVMESEQLIMELLETADTQPMQTGAYLTDLDKVMLAEAELPKSARVACQGVEGSYSNQAAEQFFEKPEIQYYTHFEDVFRAVEDGSVDYGILPIENSTAGSVAQVYDLMRKHNFYIIKDTKVVVRHNLLTSVDTNIGDLTDVYSHVQALDQCVKLREAHRNITFHEYANTAMAAKFVAEQQNPHYAALASAKCAELYNMHVLEKDVQDISGNATRFICISKTPGFVKSANRISLCFTVPHRPGSLYHILHKFALNNLNLCKLESRPYPEKKFEYMFYLDIEGKPSDYQLRWLLNDLNSQLEYFKFLGYYDEMIVEEA